MIEPTPGRVVWYWPADGDAALHQYRTEPDRPLAAIVCFVWTTSLVNLMVLDMFGQPHGRQSVRLLQGNEDRPSGAQHFCEWMPYQKGQAAKTEALEATIQGLAT